MSTKRAKSALGRVYKLRPSPASHPLVKTPRRAHGVASAPPPSVDLTPFHPGIRDQGGEGACTGFATAGFREVIHGAAVGQVLGYRLSPAYLYARTRMAEGSFPADSGATMADEFAVLEAYGVCPEDDLPYNQDPSEAPTPICDAAAVSMRIGPPCMVDMSSTSAKRVLAAGQPIGIAIPVYQSFETPGDGGQLSLPDTGTEALLGGHGILICGYDDARQSFRVANQWGTGWGDGGWCWMPYNYPMWERWTAAKEP